MTYNEEDKIGQCIQSVLQVSDEIIVLDSFSTDRTKEIAESLGARVEEHAFMGYIQQRALSVSLANNDFVLALDADEYLSPELQTEILKIKKDKSADAYYLNRINAINGYWLKHGPWFPHWIIRLFDRTKIKCEGNPPHDRIVTRNKAVTEKIKPLLMHHCNDDIHDRMATINNHSSRAADYRYSQGKTSNYFKIIFKPIWKFIVEYFLRAGFLDGFYGFLMARTSAMYIYLRESKLMELNRKKKKRV